MRRKECWIENRATGFKVSTSAAWPGADTITSLSLDSFLSGSIECHRVVSGRKHHVRAVYCGMPISCCYRRPQRSCCWVVCPSTNQKVSARVRLSDLPVSLVHHLLTSKGLSCWCSLIFSPFLFLYLCGRCWIFFPHSSSSSYLIPCSECSMSYSFLTRFRHFFSQQSPCLQSHFYSFFSGLMLS